MNSCCDCGRVAVGAISFCLHCGGPLAPSRIAAKKPKVPWVERQSWSQAKRQAQRERIYERDGHRCVTCGASKDLTLDHRIPKSRGGTNHDSNLQTMCAPCNQAKADRMPADLVGSV